MYLYCVYGFIGIVTLMGLLLPLILNRQLKKLLKAAGCPARSDHPLVKMMISKFTACYQLRVGVNNVDNFVDKYVYTYKFCGLYLSTWDKLCGQPAYIMLLLCLTGLVAVYFGYGGQIGGLSTIGIGILISCLLIVFNLFLQRKGKLSAFEREMKDYLGNSLQIKLEQEYMYSASAGNQAIRESAAARDGTARRNSSARGESAEKRADGKRDQADLLLCRDEEIIDEVLQEFLS